jgi:hypothetical protein
VNVAPSVPQELMTLQENRQCAVACARTAMTAEPCRNAALANNGDLMLLDECGLLVGTISPELFALWAEEA